MAVLSPVSWAEVAGRLSLAVAFGAVIGLDREHENKPAGLRTNMLVSLGSALFILVPLQSGAASLDPSVMGRSIQGIVTGIGFVGAGSILRVDKVRGLTTATAVWVSAALGVSAGCGVWQLGVMGLIWAIAILRLVKLLEPRLR